MVCVEDFWLIAYKLYTDPSLPCGRLLPLEKLWLPDNLPLKSLFSLLGMQNSANAYKRLINVTLPTTFTHPVCANHCFARIVLDWLFADCWYNHLRKKEPAYKQLTEAQRQAAVNRMNAWLQNPQLLVQDNEASLRYRHKRSGPGKKCGGILADRLGAQRLQRIVSFWLALFLLLFNLSAPLWMYKPLALTGMLVWGIAEPMYSIAAFPILMSLCKKEVAGSQFTAYMALINLFDIGGAYLTGWMLQVVSGPVLGFAAGCFLLALSWTLFTRKECNAGGSISRRSGTERGF